MSDIINAHDLGIAGGYIIETAMRGDVDQLENENANLRKLAVLQSVIFKHMSTCPTTDCKACPVNDECAESVYLEGILGIDNKETSWLVQRRNENAAKKANR